MIQQALRFPITSAIILVNLVIFGINHMRILGAPFISRPRVFDSHLFLSNFSHLDYFHIFMNMYLLWMIGPYIESRLPAWQYVLVIFAIWILLSLMGYFINPNPSLGFSGIGLGIMAFVALFFWGQGSFSQELIKWIGINIAIGFLPQISLAGHALGAVSGAVVFFAMRFMKFF